VRDVSSRTAFLKPWNMCYAVLEKHRRAVCESNLLTSGEMIYKVIWALMFVYSVRRSTLKFCLLTYVIQAILTSTLRISTCRHTAVTSSRQTDFNTKLKSWPTSQSGWLHRNNRSALKWTLKYISELWNSGHSRHRRWFSCTSVCGKFTECRPVGSSHINPLKPNIQLNNIYSLHTLQITPPILIT
jgi:hypothetical protein